MRSIVKISWSYKLPRNWQRTLLKRASQRDWTFVLSPATMLFFVADFDSAAISSYTTLVLKCPWIKRATSNSKTL